MASVQDFVVAPGFLRISGRYFDFTTAYYFSEADGCVSQLCDKESFGRSWHVHHCSSEKEALHGRTHVCACGHRWTNEEQLTLSPYLEVWSEAG